MKFTSILRTTFQPSSIALIILLAVFASSVFALLPIHKANAAVGDSCSYSADGKIYTGKMVDLNGVNFCDAKSDTTNTSSTTSTINSAASQLTCTKTNQNTTDTKNYTCKNGSATYACENTGDKTVTLKCNTSASGTTSSSTSTATYNCTGDGTLTCTNSTSTTSSNSAASSTASAAASAASSSANNTKTSCKRSGDTGKDLNSYLDACGGKQQIRLTKAQANKGEKVPAIILVHGGGWFSDDGIFSPSFQKRIAKWGFTTMRIKYRLMPGGVQEQLWDVQRAIRHVRENADKYGIDKNRIAVWGDSAGGSLAVRAGATGVTGVKAAVGWSAPTNAFRDLFNSYDGWVAGMYHSRCIGGMLPSYSQDVISALSRGDYMAAANTVAANVKLTPQQATSMLNSGLSLANTSMTELDSSGTLKKSDNGLGYTTDAATTDSGTTSTTTDTSAAAEKVKTELSTLNANELAAVGLSIYQFTRTVAGVSTDDPTTAETVSLMTQAANIVTQAQQQLSQERAATDGASSSTTGTGSSNPNATSIVDQIFSTSGISKSTDSTSSSNSSSTSDTTSSAAQAGNIIKTGADALGINTQIAPAQKLAECIDDFIDMSPALFASPRSPKMYLVSGAKERWVNPLDAYQMQNKLRSMGKGADAFIIPATNSKKVYKQSSSNDGHLGYDQRAEVPTLTWLKKVLKSKTDSERKAAAKKAAATKSSSNTSSTAGSTSNAGANGSSTTGSSSSGSTTNYANGNKASCGDRGYDAQHDTCGSGNDNSSKTCAEGNTSCGHYVASGGDCIQYATNGTCAQRSAVRNTWVTN